MSRCWWCGRGCWVARRTSGPSSASPQRCGRRSFRSYARRPSPPQALTLRRWCRRRGSSPWPSRRWRTRWASSPRAWRPFPPTTSSASCPRRHDGLGVGLTPRVDAVTASGRPKPVRRGFCGLGWKIRRYIERDLKATTFCLLPLAPCVSKKASRAEHFSKYFAGSPQTGISSVRS